MLDLERYAYKIPSELVAQRPMEPRDAGRLFVYDTTTDTVTFDTFRNLGAYLPPSLIVMNDTKVVPARLRAHRDTGDCIELFILPSTENENEGSVLALVNNRVHVGENLYIGEFRFEVTDDKEKWMVLKPHFPRAELSQVLLRYGTTPLPPYIHASEAEEAYLRTAYQTVIATTEASSAAPTASLHFTKDLLHELECKGSKLARVTLHVGLGTFSPVLPEHIKTNSLHSEWYCVSEDTVNAINGARAVHTPIVAVGTTVVRTLESARQAILEGKAIEGMTSLFIHPPYSFTYPDVLITNFHVPRSSLMCLVDAFLEHKHAHRRIMDLYRIALKEKFRFFSFGDAMLIR